MKELNILIHKFFHMFQNVIIYTIIGIPLAYLVNKYLPESVNSSSMIELLLYTIFQITIIVFSIYLVRRFVKNVPLFIRYMTDYKMDKGTAPLFAEAAVISLVYLSTQSKLAEGLEKIKTLLNNTFE